ncbi:hypothetical protein ACFYY5_01350 [Nocardia elegans]|uniref:Uncharacterized protein n=1 Tax=Nocardia elegans TaxID=300029 RepID=A0ABW6T5N3_9NOCA
MNKPYVNPFVGYSGETLYRVGTSKNSKKIVLTAEELLSLGLTIADVLEGPKNASRHK